MKNKRDLAAKKEAQPVSFDSKTGTLYDERTGKAYPVEQVPAGLRLGKPVKTR